MASDNPIAIIRPLIQLAVTTRIKCRDIGGAETEITQEASNLNGILRRLLQEASRPQSAFNRAGAPCRENLITVFDRCKVVLHNLNSFLCAFETINHVENTIVGTQAFAPSRLSPEQSAALENIADHFKSQIMHYNGEFSGLLIMASADALGGIPEELNNTLGCDIVTCLNELTVDLITVGKTHLASVQSAENERVLWEAVRPALARKEFSLLLVDRFRTSILAYIRALEKNSTCGDVVDTLTDVERGGTQVNQRIVSHMSSTGNTGRSVSCPLPHAAPNSAVSNEQSIQSLGEPRDPSQINQAHDIIQEIDRTLCTDYEIRYQSLLSQGKGLQAKDKAFNKELLRLIGEMEKHILIKLDEVGPTTQALRSDRKTIIDKVHSMLAELEAIKER